MVSAARAGQPGICRTACTRPTSVLAQVPGEVSLQVLRQMNKTDGQGPYFGEDFLWALLAAREDSP